jgi:hypothetical protein
VTQESGKKCRKIYIYIYIYIFFFGWTQLLQSPSGLYDPNNLGTLPYFPEVYVPRQTPSWNARRLASNLRGSGPPPPGCAAQFPAIGYDNYVCMYSTINFFRARLSMYLMSLPLVASHFSLANSHHLTSSHTPSDERLRETPGIVHRYGWVC